MNPRRRRHARARHARRRILHRTACTPRFTWTIKAPTLKVYDAAQVTIIFTDEHGNEFVIKGSDAIEDGHFVVEPPPPISEEQRLAREFSCVIQADLFELLRDAPKVQICGCPPPHGTHGPGCDGTR